MQSLRDHLLRTQAVRPRDLGRWIAPALGERARPLSTPILEEAALSVFAHIVGGERLTREGLVADQRRFERLVYLVHRLPEQGGGE